MAESHREEIAKLEALYASNPNGRVFVHLAEAYRKAGEHERARRILTDGLARHHDSASAYVVLGRVLVDMRNATEAEAAFLRVLELDGGNLIALRSLGDIARQSGRQADAARHYRELLARSPSKDNTRDLLGLVEEAEAALAAAAPASEPAPAEVQTASAAVPEPDFGVIDLDDLPGDLASFAGLVDQRTAKVESAAADLPDTDFEAEAQPGIAMDLPLEMGAASEGATQGDDVLFNLSLDDDSASGDLAVEQIQIASSFEPSFDDIAVDAEAAASMIQPVDAADDAETIEIDSGLPPVDESVVEETVVEDPVVNTAVFETPVVDVPAAETDQAEERIGSWAPLEPVEDAPSPEQETSHAAFEPAVFEQEAYPVETATPEAALNVGAAAAEPDAPALASDASPSSDAPWFDYSADAAEVTSAVAVPDLLPEPEAVEALVPAVEQSQQEPEPGVQDEPRVDDAPGFERAYGDATGGAPTEGATEGTGHAVLTETMAELYSSQGFHERAAEVYRALLQQKPGDARLMERLAAAEEAASPSVESLVEEDESGELWLRGAGTSWTGDVAHVADAGMYAWSGDGEDAPAGEPIGDLLRGILSWRRAVVTPDARKADAAESMSAPGPGREAELTVDAPVETAARSPQEDAPWLAAPSAEPEPEPPLQEAAAAQTPWQQAAPEPAPWELPVVPEPSVAEAQWAAPETAKPANEPWNAAPEPWSEPAAAPVAPPAARSPAAPPVSRQGRSGDAVEDAFNEWYSEGESNAPAPALAPAEAGASEPAPEAVSEEVQEDEDLEMFRSWLQGLKK